jgi:hypothetical protein
MSTSLIEIILALEVLLKISLKNVKYYQICQFLVSQNILKEFPAIARCFLPLFVFNRLNRWEIQVRYDISAPASPPKRRDTTGEAAWTASPVLHGRRPVPGSVVGQVDNAPARREHSVRSAFPMPKGPDIARPLRHKKGNEVNRSTRIAAAVAIPLALRERVEFPLAYFLSTLFWRS